MAKHDVLFKLPQRSLGRSDIVFIVKRDGKKYGTLAVSNGSVEWKPSNSSKEWKVSWVKFHQMMVDKGTKD